MNTLNEQYDQLLKHYEKITHNHSFLINLLLENTDSAISQIIKQYLEHLNK